MNKGDYDRLLNAILCANETFLSLGKNLNKKIVDYGNCMCVILPHFSF